MKVSFKDSSHFRDLADKVFEEQKTRILTAIPEAEIHHVGSTSIRGSITKGDLDINIRVKSENFFAAVEALKQMYEINQPENWDDDYASFKDDDSFEIDFGAQLVIVDSHHDFFTKQRDLLNSNPDLIEEYNKMKLKFENQDMDDYRKEKGVFFEKLLKK